VNTEDSKPLATGPATKAKKGGKGPVEEPRKQEEREIKGTHE